MVTPFLRTSCALGLGLSAGFHEIGTGAIEPAAGWMAIGGLAAMPWVQAGGRTPAGPPFNDGSVARHPVADGGRVRQMHCPQLPQP
jgi:hypothetical protein